MAQQTDQRPLIVSTWPFGKPANEKALEVVTGGGSILDAVEQGIGVVEADDDNGTVGLGGIPNSEGYVQCDASIMLGPGHKAGSVGALEGIVHPIGVARKVMETTRYVMLTGAGAKKFALEHGFKTGPLVTEKQRRKWEEWKAKQATAPAPGKKDNHDTIALLILNRDGNVAGGCSTSGLAYKLPGRVGDSPIIGSGLYVDNDVGAAGATGTGENVLRYCGSFLVVEYMRQGAHPTEACVETIKRIARKDPRGLDLSIHFIALDKQGRYGGAGSGKGFEYSVTYSGFSQVLQGVALSKQDVGPVGGNQPKQ